MYESQNYVAACDFLKLLRSGYDTQQMANLLNVREAFVYNMLHRQREDEKRRVDERTYQRNYKRKMREDENIDDPY